MENNGINACLKELNQSRPESQDTSTLKSNLAKAMTLEHSATALMLKYLAEFDVRGLHLREGFSSIFKFLTDGHGYFEAAAMRRLTAARFGRDCPEVFVMIERGDLSLTLASMAARAFDSQEIHESKKLEVLKALSRKSKIAAEIILAQFGAKPRDSAKKESLRVINISAASSAVGNSNQKSMESMSAKDTQSSESSLPLSVFESPMGAEGARHPEEDGPIKTERDNLTGSTEAQAPFSPEKHDCAYQLSVRLDAQTMEAFLRAKDLMGAKDFGSTIEKLVTFYNDRKDPMVDRRKKTDVKKPASQMASSPASLETSEAEVLPNAIPPLAEMNQEAPVLADSKVVSPTEPRDAFQAENSIGQAKKMSRTIPASVKRAVFHAAGGQCCYVDLDSGRRCTEKKHLEIDHIKPLATGGDHSPRNLQLLCKAHNLMRARDDFGTVFIQRKIQARRTVPGSTAGSTAGSTVASNVAAE